MKKIITGIIITAAFLFGTPATAALIEDLPSDTYISANGIDWTWASKWGTGSAAAPEAPTFHEGWRYATTSELDYLFENLVNLFLNGGNPIESTAYWNDVGQTGVNTGDLSNGYIMSGPNLMSYGNGLMCTGTTPCDTFYVRDGESIPAPAPLALLGLGLAALGFSRKRNA
ncbi:MAG: PEP-CTERM sorting domain-containing protein [Sedimenticola sp.]